VTTTDTVNTNNTAGLSAFTSIVDWSRFENPFRLWGLDGGAFPAVNNRNRCVSGTCRIWDFRLSAADDQFLGYVEHGSTLNDPFVNGAACPAAVDGNVTQVNSLGQTHLRHALEVIGSGGNDNGLCESDETCFYTPNFGAYQGSGDYTTRSCVFHDGAVSGVTMHAYPINGE
ncbi:MAG: hypothetical protein AB7P04_03455, partial [Bacteriovoracia bacterium]